MDVLGDKYSFQPFYNPILCSQNLKVRSLESTEDTMTKRLDSLVQDKEELSEALDTLKRYLGNFH